MDVMYIGSLPRVVIPDLRGRVAARGEVVEVPDALGEQLIQQRTWSRAVPEELEGEPPLEEWTVEALRGLAAEYGLDVPARIVKAELVTLIEAEVARRAQQTPDAPADDVQVQE